MHALMLSVWAWILANPVLFVPIVGAVASLVYTKLDAYPRWHAFFSMLAGFGLDLPKIVAMLQKIFTGKDPAPPGGTAAGARGERTLPGQPKPPSMQRARRSVDDLAMTLMVVAIIGATISIVGAMSMGCALLKSSNLPSDLQKNYTCVQTEIEKGDTRFASIEAACLPDQEELLVSILTTLIGSTQFGAEHASQLAALRQEVAAKRISAASCPK